MSFLLNDIDKNQKYDEEYILKLSSIIKKKLPKISKTLIFLNPDSPILILSTMLATLENHHIIVDKEPLSFKEKYKDFYNQFEQTINLDLDLSLQKNNFPNTTTEKRNFNPRGLIWTKTSGTESNPKFIGHNIDSIIASTEKTNLFLNQNSHHQNINWLLSLSLVHIGGLMILFRSWYNEHKIVYSKNPFETKYDQDSTNSLPNTISLVPTQLYKFVKNKNLNKLAESITLINISGAKVTNQHLSLIANYFPSASVLLSYGATETCSQIGGLYISSQMLSSKSCNEIKLAFTPYHDVIVKIENNITKIYSNTNYAYLFDNKLIKNIEPFVILNDLIIEESGTYKIIGRTDRVIISGGKNINLNAIEDGYQKTLSIYFKDPYLSIKAIGISDKRWGDRLVILIQFSKTSPQINEIELIDYLKSTHQFSKEEIAKNFYDIDLIKHKGIKLTNSDIIQYDCLNRYHWVCFPGFMGQHSDFSNFLNESPQRINNSTIIDYSSSFQKSSKPFDEDAIVDMIDSQIQDKNPKHRLIFLGYSMGARIMAAYLANANQSKHSPALSLIISSHLGDIDKTDNQNDERYQKDLKMFDHIKTEDDFKEFLKKWYQMPLFKGLNEERFFEEYIQTRQYLNINNYKSQLKNFSVGKMPDYSKKILNQKNLKIAMVSGSLDTKYNEYMLTKKRPHKTIKGHSHALLLQAPKELKEAIISLIKRILD